MVVVTIWPLALVEREVEVMEAGGKLIGIVRLSVFEVVFLAKDN